MNSNSKPCNEAAKAKGLYDAKSREGMQLKTSYNGKTR